MVRRVWIPKSGGGQRGLGIPNVIDRIVQQAVHQVLSPQYEPGFHDGSHGFRPGRSCHTAIAEARQHVQDGYRWVVDIDLDKFFDRVNHQRLLARLEERIDDHRLILLIRRMLKAKVVMPDGVVVSTEEGTPQGGPLSPLLSNIVLDELDRELARRGHRFVRYADDCNIYVRSERAGQRVMASIVNFIACRLRLKVNTDKSAVARPAKQHFLGFRIWWDQKKESAEVMLSKRTQVRLAEKIRRLIPRNWGQSLRDCIDPINSYLRSWLGFFGVCTKISGLLHELDSHIRRRLRAMVLRRWRKRRHIVRYLTELGVEERVAGPSIYGGHRSWWALSNSFGVRMGLRDAYFAAHGLVSVQALWRERRAQFIAPAQQPLALGQAAGGNAGDGTTTTEVR
jgi:group II intron reverse transcriptase/maturase